MTTASPTREAWFARVRDIAQSYADLAPSTATKEAKALALERVVLAFRAAAERSPKIFDCTDQSVGQCVARCAATGLMPWGHAPECDLIPRATRVKGDDNIWRDGPLELQWQIGFRGWQTLFRRAGWELQAHIIREGEDYNIELGETPSISHKPRLNAPKGQGLEKIEGAYVTWRHPDGRKGFRVLDRDQLAARRARSQRPDAKDSPWQTNPDEMCLKTVIRYAGARGDLPLDEVGKYAQDADRDLEILDAEVVQAEQRMLTEQIPNDELLRQNEELSEKVLANVQAKRADEAEVDKLANVLRSVMGDAAWTPEKRRQFSAEHELGARKPQTRTVSELVALVAAARAYRLSGEEG